MGKKMKRKEEEIMKKMFASKLVKAAIDIFLAELEARKKEKEAEEETVTLQVQYEAERRETISIPQSKLHLLQMGIPTLNTSEEIWAVATRSGGSLAQKAFVLNDEFDWELGRDSELRLCLVPLKKEKEK